MKQPTKKQLPVLSNRLFFFFILTLFVSGIAYRVSNNLSTNVVSLVDANRWIGGIALVWFGMLLAISFLESWVKFTATTVLRTQALDVGRTVFFALNRVEICWNFSILLLLALSHPLEHLQLPQAITAASVLDLIYNLPIICVAILVASFCLTLQVLIFQPYLDDRARTIISGGTPASSGLHIAYVHLEVVKTVALAYYGLSVIVPF